MKIGYGVNFKDRFSPKNWGLNNRQGPQYDGQEWISQSWNLPRIRTGLLLNDRKYFIENLIFGIKSGKIKYEKV